MLFIVTASVTRIDPGLEQDQTVTSSVVHAVEAVDSAEASSLLQRHYEQQSERDSPYGTRYSVSDVQAFAPLSLASLALAAH